MVDICGEVLQDRAGGWWRGAKHVWSGDRARSSECVAQRYKSSALIRLGVTPGVASVAVIGAGAGAREYM